MLQNRAAPEVRQLNRQENVGIWKLTKFSQVLCRNKCWARGVLPYCQDSEGQSITRIYLCSEKGFWKEPLLTRFYLGSMESHSKRDLSGAGVKK